MFLLDWPGGSWQASLRISLSILAIYLLALWVTLIFWTYRDIRQRTRDPIIQTVAVLLVLVFFLPGHWIYLILRPRYTLTELYERSLEEEALLQELEDQKACPNCNRRIRDEFLMCPFCRASLKEPCRSCSKPLSRAWLACPFCGTEKPASPRPRAVRPPHQRVPAAPPPPRRAAFPTPSASSSSGNGRPALKEPSRTEAESSSEDDAPLIDAT